MKHIFTFTLIFFSFCITNGQVPTLVGPPNIVVSCSFKFTTEDLTDTTSRLFGRIVTNLMDRKKVETNDIVCYNYCAENPRFGYPGPPGFPGNPSAGNRACEYYRALFDTLHQDRIYTMAWGFDGYLLNSEPTDYDITIIDNRSCHQGKIERKYTAYGPNNVKVTTTQTIWVIDCDPFYINALDPCDTLDDIDWPNCGKPIVINGCGITNSDTIKPKVLQDSCQLLSIEYSDNIIINNPEYCFTIIRTWVIIDWCQYVPNVIPVTGKWNYDQIIHVKDTIGPIPNKWLIDCTEADSSGLGSIGILGDADDNCTPKDWLFYTYWIDLYNDGIGSYNGYEIKVGTLTKKQVETGQLPLFNDNPYAGHKNDPTDASGKYPVGKHKYVSELIDGCGNKTRDSFFFEILPAEPPKFECPVNDFTIVVDLPKTFVFSLKDIVIFSEDNCTPFASLKVFLDGDTKKTSDIINCIDYIDNGSIDTLRRTYEVWIQDASGNSKICLINVIYVFENSCGGLTTKYFRGEFVDRKNKPIDEVDIELGSEELGLLNFSTGCDNSFTLSTFQNDTGYYILPKKPDFLDNGIDVLDIILMQFHILGIRSFDNIFSSYAADVNKSNSITASDVNVILKRILRIPSTLPDASDGFWKFLNGKDSSITEPFLYITDTINKFIGIKIGDVNADALTRCDEQKIKPHTCLNFTHPPLNIEKGKSYWIPVFSTNYVDIIGFQSSLNFNKDIIKLDTIIPVKFNFTSLNMEPAMLSTGIFNILYTNLIDRVVTYSPTDTLFKIKITALVNYSGNEFLRAADDPTLAIAYDINENPLNICVNGITTNTSDFKNEKLMVYPNPVKDGFIIKADSISGSVIVNIRNASGKLIYSRKTSGINLNGMYIDKLSNSAPGIYFISLQTEENVFSDILIKI